MDRIEDRYAVLEPPLDGWSLNLGRVAPANGLALASRLLYNRGVRDDVSARAFLDHNSQSLRDPFDLPDMESAVSELLDAVNANRRITVYGDFDADGVTATAILKQAFKTMDVECDYYLPERETEGHGMSIDAVRQLHEGGTEVLVTVDTGTTALEEIKVARQLGMTVIVTDHHVPDTQLPAASAVVNPHLAGQGADMADYCGAGIALKLATGMFQSAGVDGAEYLLPLAAIGTVADRSQLTGDNRVIVRNGLDKMTDDDNLPGITALLRVIKEASYGRYEIDSEFIGFQVAPRLNAPGRLGPADISVNLLTAVDYAEALSLAVEVNALNQARRELAQAALESVRDQMESAATADRHIVFVELPPKYPLGMLGPLAGTLNDDTGRPAVAYKLNGHLAKASARSRGSFDVHNALSGISHKLVRFGGHASAAGFQIDSADLDEVSDHLNQLARSHEEHGDTATRVNGNGEPIRTVDAEVRLDQLGGAMWEFVKQMQPFGSGNEEPRFLVRGARVVEARAVGKSGKQLTAQLADDTGNIIRAFGWGLGHLDPLPPVVDLVVSLRENNYLGNRAKELQLHAVAPSGRK